MNNFLFQVVILEKNQINFDVFPIMDLPYEILVKILSYLPNCDILRNLIEISGYWSHSSQNIIVW